MTTLYGLQAKGELEQNYPDYDGLKDGQSAKVCHTTCPAGVDTKDRFGVKRVGGAYLWHCFNCGNSGYYRPKEMFSRLIDNPDTLPPVDYSSVVNGYSKASSEYNEMPLEWRMWLMSYGFGVEECAEMGIRHLPTGIVLPITNNSTFGGYQIRTFGNKMKYLTFATKRLHYLPCDIRKPLVIVEDLLSSYKLCLAGYNAMALMGTSVKVPYSELPHLGSDAVLWLDDDVAGSKAAMQLVRELDPLYNMRLIQHEQPKELSLDRLKEIIG